MDNCNGYSMIRRVLIKQKCIVGFCMLKVKSSSKPDILFNIRTNLEASDIWSCFYEGKTVIWSKIGVD